MKRSTKLFTAAGVGVASLALIGCSSGQNNFGTRYQSGACFDGPNVSMGAPGPSLIAGDSLAFSTRLAGGYDVPSADPGSRYASVNSD